MKEQIVSVKDIRYVVVFAVPILFFAILMDWSVEGIDEILFEIIPLLFLPMFLFTVVIYLILYFDRKQRKTEKVKSNKPFIVSYLAIAIFDVLFSGLSALETYKGAPGSGFNVLILLYLPFLNIIIFTLVYMITPDKIKESDALSGRSKN